MENEMDKKDLIKYLADYIEQEHREFFEGFPGADPAEFDSEQLYDWIENGIDAFESIHNKSIFIMDKIGG
jgi:hypothetical protein